MRRHLPSLTSLVCFEASARLLSFTRAAEELNLTQSAVSRQVKNLEDFLRTDLFQRVRKRLSLTDAGRAYAEKVGRHLDGLEAESLTLIAKTQSDRNLNIGTFPAIGSHWLIPRLANFTEQHPDIPYNLVTGVHPFDLSGQELDVAIQHGKGDWPGVTAIKLFDEQATAVCTPELAARLTKPDQVLDHTLLHLATRAYAWPEWLRAKGVTAPDRLGGPRFETFGFMIRAVLAGLGIGMATRMFVKQELADGSLVEPFGPPVNSERGYFLVFLRERGEETKVRAFAEWISTGGGAGVG